MELPAGLNFVTNASPLPAHGYRGLATGKSLDEVLPVT